MAPPASGALENARKLIHGRLLEIDEERARLEGALRELGGSKGAKRGKPRKRGAPGKSKAGRAKAKSGRAGRGERPRQLLAAVKAKPGSTGAELAKAIGVPPSQIYGLLGKVQADGAIVKEGKGYRVA